LKKSLLLAALPFMVGTAFAQDGGDWLLRYEQGYLSQELGVAVPDGFDPRLYGAVTDWLGTPYRYAGCSRSGIDCSAFVREILRAAFGIEAHGNSRQLFAATRRVAGDSLQAGDLVFFTTRRKQISHVGVFLDGNRFVHSSRSRGVIVSDLGSPYYKRRYAGAGRYEPGALAAAD
jgi:lipoprotein Spr